MRIPLLALLSVSHPSVGSLKLTTTFKYIFYWKRYYLKAGLCRLCAEAGEAVGARRAADEYVRKFAQFRDSREQKFLMQLIEAVDAQDADAFTHHVAEYDAVSTLDAWYTTVLLVIKKSLQQEDDLL